MTWRREDYGYAAATLAAVAFVAYLIAGNFGLVPPILGGTHADGLPETQVAALAVANLGGSSFPTPSIAPAPAPAVKHPRVDQTKPYPGRPSIVIDTKSGTSVTLAQKATITGRLIAPAGVKAVIVTFKQNATPADVFAAPSCYEPSKCVWSVSIPATLGTYKVTAGIIDNLGRTATSNTITVTVVNVGNVVGGVVQGVGTVVQSVPQLLASVPKTLTGVVNNLLGALHL